MKRTHGVIWFFAAMCAFCLTVLANHQENFLVSEQSTRQQTESALQEPQQQRAIDATLTDATHLFRVCSSRPVRVIPTVGARSVRSITSFCTFARQYIVKSFNSFYGSRCSSALTTFCLPASCDYYVIALRHIIR